MFQNRNNALMENKFTLLEKLIPSINDYIKKGGKPDPQRFARWLTKSTEEWEMPKVDPVESDQFDPVELMNASDPNGALSFYIFRLSKYAKYYLREAFKDSPLKSADDFGYLASLAYVKSCTKSELIQMNVGETSGGMDIIKRMEKHGIIETFTDEADKRAKRVRLTEYGQGVFFSVLQPLGRVGKIVKAHLKPDEVAALVKVLHALDSFHKKIYSELKVYDLDEVEKYF